MFFDLTDDLGQMLKAELAGNLVPFDVWEDFLDKEAEDAPSMEECLEDMGLTVETALAKQVNLLAEWQELTVKLGFPADSGYEGCQWIGSHGVNHRLCCLFLSGVYRLQPQETQLPAILQGFLDLETVDAILTKRGELDQTWLELHPKLQEKTAVSMKPTAVSAYDIFNFYQEFQPSSKQNKTFLHNLMTMVEQINTVSSLRIVAPLYLYQMLKKHMKRLGKNMDLNVDLTALWSPVTYAIDHDNGKNFAQYQQDYIVSIIEIVLLSVGLAVDASCLCTVMGLVHKPILSRTLGWPCPLGCSKG